ncbi:hypothetical protein CAEBREN_19576 [Caenorhabditis brenneri]|uniref:SPK domain-containing protein n=1 Tax=Caenorhabditis brenneri TaxID=135651 RepID=G0N3X2_CAEBE|nr:hypothetical protein CAEBREN_19576 [Caenorhabditis brenneri]
MSKRKLVQNSRGYDIQTRKVEDHKMWLFIASRIRPTFETPTDMNCIRIFRETEKTWKDFVYLYDAKKPHTFYKRRFSTVLVGKIEKAPFDDLEKLNLHWALGVTIKKEYLDKIEASHEVICDDNSYVIRFKGMNTFEDWPEDPIAPLEPILDYESDCEISSEDLKRILERERGLIRQRATGKAPASAVPQLTLPAPL